MRVVALIKPYRGEESGAVARSRTTGGAVERTRTPCGLDQSEAGHEDFLAIEKGSGFLWKSF